MNKFFFIVTTHSKANHESVGCFIMSSFEECSKISDFVQEQVRKRGYPLEVHSVTTEDGYVNTLYRISQGKAEDAIRVNKRKPVLFVHGLLGSCADWVNEDKGLGYYLADSGYDVWLANCRGTSFSRGHVSPDFSENGAQYWDFSWHEIGYYDLPAFIDHVINVTNFSEVYYIGHSQGATSFFVLTASRPEYNTRIRLCCALAPTVIFDKARFFPVKLVVHLCLPLQSFLQFFHIHLRRFPFTNLMRLLIRHGKPNSFLRKLALQYLFLIAGHTDVEQSTNVDLTTIGVTTLNTASWPQFVHFCQCVRSSKFRRYDFGTTRNKEVYNSEFPPDYDVSKVTTPIALFYGKNDVFFHAEDIGKLADKLSNVIHKHEIGWKFFNHMDFLYAKDSIALVYQHILKLLKIYDK